ncbi:MAG: TnpV protein [Clostridium sp.]|nr:TnpV protein [Clostridium sp.]MCM1569047.1 TnpV protein [Roseburia sp.]
MENPIKWIGRMNRIQSRANEIINGELIFA